MSLEYTQRAYAAGVIDCDGSIFIASSGKQRHCFLRVAVYNTRKGLIEWFVGNYGGSINKVKRGGRSAEYSWSAHGKDAAVVLMDILPYLVIKREQALIGIEFASTIAAEGTNTSLPNEVRALRERLRIRIRELNRKGIG